MVKVDPQALRDHAARLANGPMARVKTAADAANTVRLGVASGFRGYRITPSALLHWSAKRRSPA